jgi:aldehyde:ferredoxin oxidoreductase
MHYGWMGVDLEIDLSRGSISKTEIDQDFYERYIGGKGTNVKFFWDRVTPKVDPFSQDNPLIIGNGVLTGTIVPSANRAVITCRSPQTLLHHYSAIGGFWPAEFKHAGYDTLILSGKATAPAYVYIHDDKIELRDARHLWGKGTHETKRLIREDLDNPRVEVLCIGPSGENKVYGASIEDGTGASASRCGIGAIMGDKNLKAIAVHGTKDVFIAKPTRLFELCQHILSRTGNLRSYFEYFAHGLNQSLIRSGYFGNWSETYRETPPEFQDAVKAAGKACQELIDSKRVREVACQNCGARCKHVYHRPNGGYSFIKCQSWEAFMTSAKIIDYDFALKCYDLCEDYGLDTSTVSRCVAFAIDLYEKGILTKKETEGMHLEWGNKDIVLSLIAKITRREGIGDVLANGVYEAARHIGQGAEEYAHHAKKVEPIPASGAFNSHWAALVMAVSDKGDCTRNMSIFTQGYWAGSKESREEYIKSGYNLYPIDYEQYLLTEFDRTGDNHEATCQLAAYDQEMFCITDLAGICNFWSCFMPYPPINTRSLKAELISCVTGMELDEDALTQIARRVINLVRSCNVRLGLKREDERPPKLLFERISQKTKKRRIDPGKFNRHIDRYYELMGWDKNGIPTTETLEKLDLDYVIQDLEQRDIL